MHGPQPFGLFNSDQVFSSPMRASKPPLLTNDNTLSTTLKLLKDVGEALQHIPYIKAVAGISIQILEIREVSSNRIGPYIYAVLTGLSKSHLTNPLRTT